MMSSPEGEAAGDDGGSAGEGETAGLCSGVGVGSGTGGGVASVPGVMATGDAGEGSGVPSWAISGTASKNSRIK